MSHRQTPQYRPFVHPKNVHHPYSQNLPSPKPFPYPQSTPHQQWPPPPSPSVVCNRSLAAPSFAAELRSHRRLSRAPVVEPLIKQCNPAPYKYFVYSTRFLAGRMVFRRKSDAAEAVVFFWERRIAGDHVLTPFVKFFDDELEERVKGLFVSHVKSLVEGELMQKMEKKTALLMTEVRRVSAQLRRPRNIKILSELRGKQVAYQAEIELISKRMEEFRCGMKCILRYIEGNNTEHSLINGEFEAFDFEDGLDWSRIHSIVMRECRRLEDGLPIYGFRLEILGKLFSEQVRFCHSDGDLFTMLSVYKEWESMPRGSQNKWCWENSINAKSMRRCYDTVLELENCLKNELGITIPSCWIWNPYVATDNDKW